MIQDAPLSEILRALEKAQELARAMQEAEADQWLNADEAAAYLNIGPSVFRKMAASGELPRHRISGEYRYHRAELKRWALEK